jgi:hypothetical protein
MQPVKILNMTDLFNKEILVYSFYDIRFKKPLRVVVGIYFIIVFLLLGLPFLKLTEKYGLTPWRIAPAILIPYFLAKFMAKPIFNGRAFFAAMKVQIKYLLENKIFYDNKPGKKLENYKINEFHLISRRKDYSDLYKMKYTNKKGVPRRS